MYQELGLASFIGIPTPFSATNVSNLTRTLVPSLLLKARRIVTKGLTGDCHLMCCGYRNLAACVKKQHILSTAITCFLLFSNGIASNTLARSPFNFQYILCFPPEATQVPDSSWQKLAISDSKGPSGVGWRKRQAAASLWSVVRVDRLPKVWISFTWLWRRCSGSNFGQQSTLRSMPS